ncbi:hypothetical protein GCM10010376_86380 [Streptomyces violaceusniger]
MRPDSFGSQLRVALTRDTPAFQPTPHPARQGFIRQLVDALAHITPAFQTDPASAQQPSPGGGTSAQAGPCPATQRRARQSATTSRQQPTTPSEQRQSSQELTDQGRFLTVAEVASLMRIGKMTVYRLVHSGHLPAVRVGRAFKVPEQAVHDYLQENVRNVS